MNYSNKLIPFIFLLYLCLSACNKMEKPGKGEDRSGQSREAHQEHPENEVELTRAQIETIGLTLGTFDTIKAAGFIKANGILDLPPDEIATVTAPARGVVRSTQGEYLVGSFVPAGTVLATLEHPDFISLQQQFLEVSAQLEFQQQEVARQQNLQEGEAGVKKNFQQATSELKQLQARRDGLEGQLAFLGISGALIREKGIVPSVRIKAPISGYITALNINQGRFVQPEEMLYEIVDNRHIHLELDIFEKDIARVKEKMRISFTVPSLGEELFAGEIRLVGRSFNMEHKTVRVHGHIEGKHPAFIRGLYVEARIWTDDNTAPALPEDAIVREDGLSYIFVKTAEREEVSHFRRIAVKTGNISGNYIAVEPLEDLPDSRMIVTGKAYFLAAQMVKGELAHEH